MLTQLSKNNSIFQRPDDEQVTETESDSNFLQMIQDKINTHEAYKVSKHGFQYSDKEKREALAFKHQLKNQGRLQKKDIIPGMNKSKKSYNNIQIKDEETEDWIDNFIMSFDLLSNVEYDREAECYRARSAFDQQVRDPMDVSLRAVCKGQQDAPRQETARFRKNNKDLSARQQQEGSIGSARNSQSHRSLSQGGRPDSPGQAPLRLPTSAGAIRASRKSLSIGKSSQRSLLQNQPVDNSKEHTSKTPKSPQKDQADARQSKNLLGNQVVKDFLEAPAFLSNKNSETESCMDSRRNSQASSRAVRSNRRSRKQNCSTVEEPPQQILKGLKDLSPQDLLDLTTGRKSLETLQIEQLSQSKWIDLLLHSDLRFCPYNTFEKLLKNPNILNKVSLHLLEVHGCKHSKDSLPQFTRAELDHALLSHTSKDLYIKFREKKLTFDQLKARTAEKMGMAKYTVLDDIRDKLHPDLLGKYPKRQRLYNQLMDTEYEKSHAIALEQIIHRKLEPWELNPHCVRSLTFEQNQSRHQTEEQRLKTLQKLQKISKEMNQGAFMEEAVKEQDDAVLEQSRNVPSSDLQTKTMTKKKPDQQKIQWVQFPGETSQEFQDRQRHQRLGEHFERYLKWHQNTVKSQICFYSSQCDVTENSLPDGFGNIQNILNKKQTIRASTSVPPLEKSTKPDKGDDPLQQPELFELEDDAASAEKTCLSARLNVSYLNFGKVYEYKNMQASANNLLNQEEANTFAMRERAKQEEQRKVENVEKERSELKKRLAELNRSKAITKESETMQKGEVDLMLPKPAMKTRTLACQKELSKKQLETNYRKRMIRIAQNGNEDKNLQILVNTRSAKSTLPKNSKQDQIQAIKDLERAKQEKLDNELQAIRDVVFMKKLKDDGKDVVISGHHRKLLKVDDRLLKAMIEDCLTPRANLDKIKRIQAMRDAMYQNSLGGAAGGDGQIKPTTSYNNDAKLLAQQDRKSETQMLSARSGGAPGAPSQQFMSNIDFEEEEKNQIELLNPNMKPYEIKEQKMDTQTQVMEIEGELLLEAVKNKMRRHHKSQNGNRNKKQSSSRQKMAKNIQKRQKQSSSINNRNNRSSMELRNASANNQSDQAAMTQQVQMFRDLQRDQRDGSFKMDTQQSRNVGKIMGNLQYQQRLTEMQRRPRLVSPSHMSELSGYDAFERSLLNHQPQNVHQPQMRAGLTPVTPPSEPLSPVISLVGASKRYQDGAPIATPSGDNHLLMPSNTNVRIFQQQINGSASSAIPLSFDPRHSHQNRYTPTNLISRNIDSKSRNDTKKRYETETYKQKDAYNSMARLLEKDEQQLKHRQQDYLASQALLKSQELRLRFCQHNNQKLNRINKKAIEDQIKASGYVCVGGSSLALPFGQPEMAMRSISAQETAPKYGKHYQHIPRSNLVGSQMLQPQRPQSSFTRQQARTFNNLLEAARAPMRDQRPEATTCAILQRQIQKMLASRVQSAIRHIDAAAGAQTALANHGKSANRLQVTQQSGSRFNQSLVKGGVMKGSSPNLHSSRSKRSLTSAGGGAPFVNSKLDHADENERAEFHLQLLKNMNAKNRRPMSSSHPCGSGEAIPPDGAPTGTSPGQSQKGSLQIELRTKPMKVSTIDFYKMIQNELQQQDDHPKTELAMNCNALGKYKRLQKFIDSEGIGFGVKTEVGDKGERQRHEQEMMIQADSSLQKTHQVKHIEILGSEMNQDASGISGESGADKTASPVLSAAAEGDLDSNADKKLDGNTPSKSEVGAED